MSTTKRDVMGEIVDAVIACLERGTMPWRRPWVDGRAGEGAPHNAISGRAYSGINYLQLTMHGMGYTSQSWLTFKQAKEAGGSVKKGEHGTAIVFWKPMDATKRGDDGTLSTSRFLMMRSFTVLEMVPEFRTGS